MTDLPFISDRDKRAMMIFKALTQPRVSEVAIQMCETTLGLREPDHSEDAGRPYTTNGEDG